MRHGKEKGMTEERIYWGLVEDSRLVIIPVGHVTAMLCPGLRAKAQSLLRPDTRVKTLHFDFSACGYMDSTFMGLIVYLAKALRGLGLARPLVHQADAQCMSLFQTMGMTKLLEFPEAACPRPASVEEILAVEPASAGFLLDVHRELSALSGENTERFSALNAALEKMLYFPPDSEG